MKILIATPAYGGVVYTAYHEAILQTVTYFQENFPEIRFVSKTLSLSLISTARNIFASIVLNDPSYSHLLFVDADMGFSPSLIARMLALRKPVVGIIAPQRRLDYEAYHQARSITENAFLARVIGNDYVGGEDALLTKATSDGSREIDIIDGFLRVSHTGTGIMLIERSVIEAMRERYKNLWLAEPAEGVRRSGLSGGLLQCFEQARDASGNVLGEDVSFCLRWSHEMGGEIWANVDEPIVHVGQENFTGHYLTKLRQSGIKLNILAAQ